MGSNAPEFARAWKGDCCVCTQCDDAIAVLFYRGEAWCWQCYACSLECVLCAALTPAPAAPTDTALGEAEALADELCYIARSLPDSVSKETCEKINRAAEILAALASRAAPPDAPVKGAVTKAQIDAAAVALSKRIYKQTEGEWQPNIRQADELARAALNAALRALAGGQP